ncbi:hypothetical protein QR680_005000 [Steinernema hermaphroditum]|uniref:Uncharacterized protein n=1 Tax=Steinernema hermaphroditum TaxID=289476 RepID=A0AA39LU37_9BILA|nr:hypothetical protein QR680_005000 [Steinernema hermaphroditum]
MATFLNSHLNVKLRKAELFGAIDHVIVPKSPLLLHTESTPPPPRLIGPTSTHANQLASYLRYHSASSGPFRKQSSDSAKVADEAGAVPSS